MENIREKVSYLKGLSDGLEITHETKEGKILLAIIDVIDDLSLVVDELDNREEELEEYVEAIDEDLADVENDIYEEEDDEDDDGFIEVECPTCHETVYLDEDMFQDEDEEIVCPSCGEPILFSNCDCEECADECCDEGCNCHDK